ncbi:MAG: ATP-binding cassette domain-containing protein [Defluviitaleaceae bacterium]|nr:ATP-binding cassette domain-containing protein [Defluviitaleaceae bacterium]
MLIVSNVSLQFASKKLFDEVNIKFTPGNCYGIIGANGAGKSTFLKIISKEIEPTTGEISMPKNTRMSVLKQDHYVFDEYSILDTVIMGNMRLYQIGKEKDAIYLKEDFNDEDGIKAAELEAEFSEMGGWEAESEAAKLLINLGIHENLHNLKLKELEGSQKVKVLLAQALFGSPDIIVLDEPTNDLDIAAISWLQEFLINFSGIVIVVSHDRYFLNNVCTMMADVDFGKIRLYTGNYDFWYQSSRLALQMMRDQNKKKEDKIKELQTFIQRFSANASKSKQATSRKKMLDKITLDDIQPSTRKYPFVVFKPEREVGNDILTVDGISKTVDGVKLLDNIKFSLNKEDKIAFIGNEIAITTLFKILEGEEQPDSGEVKFGITITKAYFPKDNTEFFEGKKINLVEWLRQYSKDDSENYLRGFLGKMLFSGDETAKKVSVLSGGEKVRMMLSRIMMFDANLLIMDQPTNHLDLETITALNDGLLAYPSNILFSSHDHEFIQTLANRIIEIKDGKIIDRQMTYNEYLEYMKESKV